MINRIKFLAKRKAHIFLILLFFIFCRGEKMFEIGDKVSEAYLKKSNISLIMTSSSDLSKSFATEINNIKYIFAFDGENIINYIDTKDSNFRTPEGFSILTSLKTIIEKTNAKPIKEAGWAFYIPLESGWNAAFIEGENMTDRIPSDETLVKFFFKRK